MEKHLLIQTWELREVALSAVIFHRAFAEIYLRKLNPIENSKKIGCCKSINHDAV